jgi:hypothetical protein
MRRARAISNRCKDRRRRDTINCSQDPLFSSLKCYWYYGLPGLNAPDDFMHDDRQAPPHVDDSRSLSSTDPRQNQDPAQLKTKTVSLYHVFEHA